MPRNGKRRSSVSTISNQGPNSQMKKKSPKTLTLEEIDFLKTRTRFTEREIKECYRGFKHDCPDGRLNMQKIKEMYQTILPLRNPEMFAEQTFRVLDVDDNGCIDFKEFLLALDITAEGSPEEKLRWAFKMYDKDNSKVVELEEMIEMIGILYEMQGVSKDTATEHAKAVFNTLDIDGDGELTEEEFIKGFLKDLEKVEALSP